MQSGPQLPWVMLPELGCDLGRRLPRRPPNTSACRVSASNWEAVPGRCLWETRGLGAARGPLPLPPPSRAGQPVPWGLGVRPWGVGRNPQELLAGLPRWLEGRARAEGSE